MWVSGPSVGLGYWERTELTSEVFGARLSDTKDGPFLRTGDLGFLHQGQLYITGRLKDLVIIRGRNYYPQDIEHSVGTAAPSLRAGCTAAFGLEIEGRERLVVVQEADETRIDDPNDVMACIRTAIARDHKLRVAAIVLLRARTMPKTTSGKVQRKACRDGFVEGTLDVLHEWRAAPDAVSGTSGADASNVESWLQERVAASLGITLGDVDAMTPLGELGLDSVAAAVSGHADRVQVRDRS